MDVTIEGVVYRLELDLDATFVLPEFNVAYNDVLANNYKPVILDTHVKKWGSHPVPPEFMAYRFIIDNDVNRLCAIYEIYWREQDCDIQNLNKDHEHDYEQVQIHFSLDTGLIVRVAVAAVGKKRYGGHGVEVYSQPKLIDGQKKYDFVQRNTSPRPYFPGGSYTYITEVKRIEISKLAFRDRRPILVVVNCYHVFAGGKQKQERTPRFQEAVELSIPLKRLDEQLLQEWYNYKENPYRHDISAPFEEPYMLYKPHTVKCRIFYWLVRQRIAFNKWLKRY